VQRGTGKVLGSSSVIYGGPSQVPSNEELSKAKVSSASPPRSVLLNLALLWTELVFLQF